MFKKKISIRKIDHVNISVTDLETTKTFFTTLLDFRVEKEGILSGEWIDAVVHLKNVHAKYVKLVLPGTETNLELIRYFTPKGARDPKINQANQIGFRHIALEVEDIEAACKRLRDAGVSLFSDIHVYNKKKKLCYFSGPDGIILELAQYDE